MAKMNAIQAGHVAHQALLFADLNALQRVPWHGEMKSLDDLLKIGERLAERVCANIATMRDQIGEIDDAMAESMISAVELFYDRYIGPYNIDIVPDAVEPMVDGLIRSMIRPSMLKVIVAYNKA